jgi:hypothetical protein
MLAILFAAALSSSATDVRIPQAPVAAKQAAAADFTIDGFRFTSDSPVQPRIRRSLEAQVRIVTGARLRPDVLALFRERPIRLVPTLGQPGVTGPQGVTLEMSEQPAQNPVLLHEFVHFYQLSRLRGTPGNGVVTAAYQRALASGRWPAGSYMLSNVREFFAMTASVLLHGRAARPPSTAAAVREAMPEFARWIVQQFRG